MKTYKLTQDIGTHKSGMEVEVPEDGACAYYLDASYTLHFDSAITALLIKTGILEEVKEEKWPKRGNGYYYLLNDGAIDSDEWDDHSVDYKRQNFLGIFRTREEAQKRIEQIREFVKGLD